MRVRSILGVLAVTAMLTACGAGGEPAADRPTSSGPTTPTPTASTPARFEPAEADRATAAAAEAQLNAALDRLMDRPFTFAGMAPIGLGTVSTQGQVDAARKDSATSVVVPTTGQASAATLPPAEINLESRFIAGRGYVGVPNVPGQGCWFDAASLPGAEVGEQSWIPYALAALGTASAQGFAGEKRDVVVVESDATNLTGVILAKAARTLYVEDRVPVTAEVTLEEGRITGLSYELRDAVEALLDAGASLPDDLDRAALLDTATGKVDVRFAPGVSAPVKAPKKSELVDMSKPDAASETCRAG
ncbi:hypothetical protein H9L21_04615 [Aeromicrobium senzhongii]|uniref:LppX_LprAFG lipoprotein n=1 Tax=Aeromicrobium senzhongii TaxID=2663859 RepID=A0ABX6SV08_9ACTN|nr:hypothetical protein [Aeromicrobium senzhongii]MTB87750.1 hypothetical protein [Aeromicrobium senzhongii]QNL95224.1 hypothetical protein H9L21_04615 [Aeromicrobium senzhongii]